MHTDAELVKACLNGEKHTFAVLVSRYERSVRAAAWDVLSDYHAANEAAQDAFVAAYENLSKLRKPDAFGPWLMKITRRAALNFARRRTKKALLQSEIADPVENPNNPFDEEKQRLLTAVMKLPESEKQVIMLRYFADNSVKDVADIVGRSIGTVTKQLSRAHKRLRKILRQD